MIATGMVPDHLYSGAVLLEHRIPDIDKVSCVGLHQSYWQLYRPLQYRHSLSGSPSSMNQLSKF